MIQLRKATQNEIRRCAEFIDEARAHQREQGFVQWSDDYPNADTVREDLELGRGYVITSDNEPFGYLCIDFAGEPVYDVINIKWKSDMPYAAVHRVAIGDSARGKGASRELFRLIRELCLARGFLAIRIDTQDENKKMQHVLEREGFQYCGNVYYDGFPRMGYELDF